MRFYLDSAVFSDIRACAALPYVAGVTTNPGLFHRAGDPPLGDLLDVVVACERLDWKLWIQLPDTSPSELVALAEQTSKALASRTGGAFSGPTWVAKLVPTPSALLAAPILGRLGIEVCITGIANPLQAAAVVQSPAAVHLGKNDSFRTEGPPASRRPFAPEHIACYVGRVDDSGRDGIDTVRTIARTYDAQKSRTRILAASIRGSDVLARLCATLAEAETSRVDVTLPPRTLMRLLGDPVSADALESFHELPAIQID